MATLAIESSLDSSYEPKLDGEAITSNRYDFKKYLWAPRERSEFWRTVQLFDQSRIQLLELATLGENWDSYGADSPNEIARDTAAHVLALLKSLSLAPTRIVASSEGGVGICFVNEDRYADFECFNTGEIVAVRYIGTGEPHVWGVTSDDEGIKAAIEQIRAHFSA